MSLDIISFAEKRNDQSKWQVIGEEGVLPFRGHLYGEFFCGTSELANLTPIDEDRGLPGDASETVKQAYKSWSGDALFATWLTVQELLDFDYDQTFECHYYKYRPSAPIKISYSEYLPRFDDYIAYLNRMKDKGVERLVFWYCD